MSYKLSLYIHLPFCKRKCRYCDYYSIFDTSGIIDSYIHALKKEWELIRRKYHLDDAVIQTIYCGGGTPPLLSVEQWQLFRSAVIDTLTISNDAERIFHFDRWAES